MQGRDITAKKLTVEKPGRGTSSAERQAAMRERAEMLREVVRRRAAEAGRYSTPGETSRTK